MPATGTQDLDESGGPNLLNYGQMWWLMEWGIRPNSANYIEDLERKAQQRGDSNIGTFKVLGCGYRLGDGVTNHGIGSVAVLARIIAPKAHIEGCGKESTD